MKIRRYNPATTEPELLLDLREVHYGVELVVVDRRGTRKKSILSITEEGTLKVFACANSKGLDCDHNGRIRCSSPITRVIP